MLPVGHMHTRPPTHAVLCDRLHFQTFDKGHFYLMVKLSFVTKDLNSNFDFVFKYI